MRLLKKIHFDTLTIEKKQQIYHLKALIHQALQEYYLAESFYQNAISISSSPRDLGAIPNDYASLLIEQWKLHEAKILLLKNSEIVKDKDVIEEAFNL
jgi:Tfp pilus assembly protein PilF